MTDQGQPGAGQPGLPDPAAEPPSEPLGDLSLAALRSYRRKLADEEEKVSYWRRLVHARMDLLEAESSAEGPLPLEKLSRVLGDTGAGRTRKALARVRAAEPLPELPVLEQMWVSEVDPEDREAVDVAVRLLRKAEEQLTAYRTALHGRLDEATAELIVRYRSDPSSALVAFEDAGPRPPSRSTR